MAVDAAESTTIEIAGIDDALDQDGDDAGDGLDDGDDDGCEATRWMVKEFQRQWWR